MFALANQLTIININGKSDGHCDEYSGVASTIFICTGCSAIINVIGCSDGHCNETSGFICFMFGLGFQLTIIEVV